jgi:uncharacterized Zn finger protein (UPF0148 family)
LDGCSNCGSVRLARRLGEVECRVCGHVVPPEAGETLPGIGSAPGLAEEVALALERVLGRADRKRTAQVPLS